MLLKIFIKLLSGFFALILLVGKLSPALADDLEPTETTWGTIYTDDGFSNSFTIYQNGTEATYSDLGTENTYSLEIQCEAKELTVLMYSEPIGIYPSYGKYRIGTSLVKIDSGKISKYKYVAMKNSSGIVLWSPKLLTAAMLKGKKQVAFKVPSSVQNDAVAVFNLGDLSTYTSKFKSLGCPLK